MPALFDTFPSLVSKKLLIRKMADGDVESLAEITENENVYRYILPFLYKKSKKSLLTAIHNLGGRDFAKKKMIIAGVYLRSEPQKLIGLAEIFDYHKKSGQVTIGYRINENYWHQGIATDIVALLVEYLSEDIKIATIKAFVVPENIYSAKALLKNGFKKEESTTAAQNWGEQDTVTLEVYTYCRSNILTCSKDS